MWFVALSLAGCSPTSPVGPPEIPDSDSGAHDTDSALVAEMDDPVPPTPSVPVYGGTIAVRDGLVVAADPGQDTLAFWRAGTAKALDQRVLLSAGAQPFRVVLSNTHAYVTLRGTGEVAKFELSDGKEVARAKVCAAPRGLQVTEGGLLYVACAGGRLVTLRSNLEVLDAWFVDTDLRDVVVEPSRTWISRFRSAEVLLLESGTPRPIARYVPAMDATLQPRRQPRVAWRMVSRPQGGVYLIHQVASTAWILLNGDAPLGDTGSLESFTGRPAYGTDEPSHCIGPSPLGAALTRIDEHGEVVTLLLNGLATVTDLSVRPDGAILFVTAEEADLPVVYELSDADFDDPRHGRCLVPRIAYGFSITGVITSVAAHRDGEGVAAYSRGPGTIHTTFGPMEVPDRADRLPSTPMLELFQHDTGHLVTCANCHPEGQEDGHLWRLSGMGPRRTKSLGGGLAHRAPYFWDGSQETLPDLMFEVYGGRMGGSMTVDQANALGEWISDIPTGSVGPTRGDADVLGGQVAFDKAGCATCHSGEWYTDNQMHVVSPDVGPRQTPSLRGLGNRGPYFHDGCAATLRDVFTNLACARTGHQPALDRGDLNALIAFLETR